MTLDTMLALARQHLNSGTMESSARLCLADAIDAKDRGDYDAAASWAVRSLSYSVGVFHPAYERATHALRTDAHLPPSPAAGGCSSCGHDNHDGLVCHHVSGEDEPTYCDCDRAGSDD